MEVIDDQLHGRDIVHDILYDLLDQFEDILLEKELSSQEIPNAVKLAMAKMESMVKLATMTYDGISLLSQPFEEFHPDHEPIPSNIDSWARGMVITRKVVSETESFRASIPSSNSNTPSVSSFRSSITGRSRGTKSRNGTSHSRTSTTTNANDKTGQIFDLEEDEFDKEFGHGANFNATGAMFQNLQKQVRLIYILCILCILHMHYYI
jgi:hypothetical protein